MSKVKIKAQFELKNQQDKSLVEGLGDTFSNTLADYESVPRIGEWVDLLDFAPQYGLNQQQLSWLSGNEHKFQIENVNIRDGYYEIELDMDKIWPAEA